MAQIIQQAGSLGSQLGAGFGKGLAEQLPKEVDRYRLSKGLEEFSKNSANLSPLEQYTKLAAIPGITPAMMQALPEILKQQNLRQAYTQQGNSQQRREREPMEEIQKNGKLSNVNFANLPQNKENVGRDEIGQPQILEKNPLRQEVIPRKRWSNERLFQERSDLSKQFPNLPIEQINEMVSEKEQRYLNEPADERAQDEFLRAEQERIQGKFTKQLETKLQKTGEGVFKDVTGDALVNLQRGLEKELKTSPDVTEDDIINKWTNKASRFAKTKTKLDTFLKSRDPVSDFINKSENLDRLKEYADIFKEANNQEELFNILQTDADLTPEGSATIAYPRNERIKKYVSSVKPQKVYENIRIGGPIKDFSKQSRKYAVDIENLIGSDDSILAIMNDLSHKDPFFDRKAFIDQLRENKDKIGLTTFQRDELAEGTGDIFSSWGDLFTLPIFGG